RMMRARDRDRALEREFAALPRGCERKHEEPGKRNAIHHSFVPQRLDRIEARGAAGRIQTEDDSERTPSAIRSPCFGAARESRFGTSPRCSSRSSARRSRPLDDALALPIICRTPLIAFDSAVFDDDRPLRERCDVGLVGDENRGDAPKAELEK